MSSSAGITVWCFSDGKAGHDNQTRGLLRALQDLLPVQTHWVLAERGLPTFLRLMRGNFDPGHALPDPDLIIGCGHGTHLAMLAARRARGGRIVLLMTPSLPLQWFDLCVPPVHDGVSERPGVLITRGPLNALQPARKLEQHGLILLGGPSRHYGWSARALLEQIQSIALREPQWQWTAVSSRRTPPGFLDEIQSLQLRGLTTVDHSQTGPEWLPFRLGEAPRVWVTEDSVSMMYEALTANAAVGVLALPRLGLTRVVRGLDQLIEDGLVLRHTDWLAGRALSPPVTPFNEAARCAAWIQTQWLHDH